LSIKIFAVRFACGPASAAGVKTVSCGFRKLSSAGTRMARPPKEMRRSARYAIGLRQPVRLFRHEAVRFPVAICQAEEDGVALATAADDNNADGNLGKQKTKV
jgi:hypothetical protein